MPKLPVADLHTPNELLSNARAMYASGNPQLFRGAILEAITALEAFVQQTVFTSLLLKLDPQLVKWLENKTRMDFDTRLSFLIPLATGLPIDTSSTLWESYKKAKNTRNRIIHLGQRVTAKDVLTVIDTVSDWLSFLGSTVELETVLLDFKRWVEQNTSLSIQNERQATQLVVHFFQQTRAAKASIEEPICSGAGRRWADVILDFGQRNVLVETKFVQDGRNAEKVIKDAITQVDQLRRDAKITKACVITFLKGATAEIPNKIESHDGGTIVSVNIRVR